MCARIRTKRCALRHVRAWWASRSPTGARLPRLGRPRGFIRTLICSAATRREIIAIGYAAGAFHVARCLAHREFQPDDSDIAGRAGIRIYKSSADGDAGERPYFGGDPSKQDDRSALPGLLSVQLPLMLAWSATDPQRRAPGRDPQPAPVQLGCPLSADAGAHEPPSLRLRARFVRQWPRRTDAGARAGN